MFEAASTHGTGCVFEAASVLLHKPQRKGPGKERKEGAHSDRAPMRLLQAALDEPWYIIKKGAQSGVCLELRCSSLIGLARTVYIHLI